MVTVSMRSVLLVMRLILYTTSPGMTVTIAMTGLVIGAMIGPVQVMEIVGVLMVGAVRNLDDLVKSPPLGGLAMMSSMSLDVVLGVRGLKDALLEVEALLLQDPVPVDRQQPPGVLRQMRELAMARLPHIGAHSTPRVKGPVLVGPRGRGMRRLNIWESWLGETRPSRHRRLGGLY